MNSNLLLIRNIFVLLIFIYSCTGQKTESTETAVDNELPLEIQKVNFFLETSASMGGYLEGSADLVRNIPNLLVDIEGRILKQNSNLDIYFVADSLSRYQGTTHNFIREISTTRVAQNRSSEMHKIFELIGTNTGPDQISLFVSDCILSYSDDEIKKDSQINRNKASGALKADIKSTFNQLKAQNMVATVYGFNSTFFGNYYTYENKKLKIDGDLRPYYLWVIGTKPLVQKFNDELVQFPKFDPSITMSFGLFDEESLVNNYDLFFAYQREGSWSINGKTISKVSAKSPSKIAVALNLTNLPSYAKSPQYLQDNLILKSVNGDFSISSIELTNNIDKSLLKANEQKLIQENTHILLLDIQNIYEKDASVELTLPLKFDETYKPISIMDDRTIDLLDSKTFALEHLIDGVREAYENQNKNYISISIPVKKQ